MNSQKCGQTFLMSHSPSLWCQCVSRHPPSSQCSKVQQHQYAYRKNHSISDAVSSVIHSALTHLESGDSYIRLLFLDFSSAFNTIIPQTLANKRLLLGLIPSICMWVLNFLTHWPQSVKIHGITSSPIILSTGSPQGCIFSPLLYTLFTYNCSVKYLRCTIVKFAEDTAVVGLISHNDELSCRQELKDLVDWCSENNLSISAGNAKELVVDFRRISRTPCPLLIGGEAVEMVDSFKYLGVHISRVMTWATATIIKKAHQCLFLLRRLRQAGL